MKKDSLFDRQSCFVRFLSFLSGLGFCSTYWVTMDVTHAYFLVICLQVQSKEL